MNPYRLVLDGKEIDLLSPYNLALVERIRALPRRRWVADKRHWQVPVVAENAKPLLELAAEYKFDVPDDVKEALESVYRTIVTGKQIGRAHV